MRSWIIIIILLIIPIFLFSQEGYSFTCYDVSKGLSENHVITILQDQEGFMWFGTMGGLNRFDGNDFKVIASDPKSALKLFNHRIHNLWEDKHQNIWINVFGNTFHKMNEERNKITHYPQSLGFETHGPQNSILIHDDGFTIMAFEQKGVFIEKELKTGTFVKEYLFGDDLLKEDIGIHSIHAYNENNIFLVTTSGPVYLKIDKKTGNGKFRHFCLEKEFQASTTNARILDDIIYFISSEHGLMSYDINKDEFKLKQQFNGIKINKFQNLTVGKDNSLWLGSAENGIIGFGRNLNDTVHIESNNDKTFGEITDVYADRSGNIWFSSINFNGIFKYAIDKNVLKFFPVNMKESHFRITESSGHLLIYLFQDSNDVVWIGSLADGIFRYDPKSDDFSVIKNDPDDLSSLSTNDQLFAYEDRSKNLWFGTKSGGVNKLKINDLGIKVIKPEKKPASRLENKIYSVYRDSYGNLWVSMKNGKLYIYDKENHLKKVFAENILSCTKANYSNTHYFCMLEDSKGRFWMGSKGEGLLMADLKEIKGEIDKIVFKKFSNSANNLHSLHADEVYDLYEDLSGRIWIATYDGGLGLLAEENDEMKFINFNNYLSSLLPKNIQLGRYVSGSRDGKIWYGGVFGACSFELENNTLEPKSFHFYDFQPGKENSLVYNDIKCIFEDYQNNIWIGTWGGGVSVWKPDQKKFISYTKHDGLSSDIIYGITQTRDSMIWLTTEYGLSRFDPNKESFRNFYMEDGLPSNSFTEAKPFLNNDGTLYLGTIEGLMYFKSPEIKSSDFQPRVLFTKLYIDNDEVMPETDGIIKKGINKVEKLNLSYDKNSFQLQLISTDYTDPDKIQYSFFLEGFDNIWNTLIESNSVSYYQVPPGNYTLKIKSTNRDGVWSEHTKTLPVQISPPWWKSQLAFLIYLFLGTGVFIVSIIVLKRIYGLQHMLKIEKEITQFKLRFFTNLSHDFRTPLSLIINPSEELKNSELDAEQQSLINLVAKNARYLMGLINQILDFRTLQEKQSRLKITHNNLSVFFNSIAENFEYVARKSKIEYNYFINVNNNTYAWFDTEKLEKIITNLLSNAFKYTNHDGKITFTLILENTIIKIIVEDTGKGIELARIPNIYKRFSQNDDSVNFFHQGTGIGLSLVKEFVTLHKGKISVNSKINIGSKFEISIPCDRDSYDENEFVPKRNWIIGSASNYISGIYDTGPESENGSSESKYSVLIVEDNPELREYLTNKFSNCYKTESASNGKEGLDLAKNNFPDIIVSDNIMPEMNGVEMTRELKSDPVTSHIPIILLSVKFEKEDRLRGLEMGADDYIEKPFDLDVLFAKVNNIIKKQEILKAKFSNELDFKLPEVSTNEKDKVLLKNIEKMILEKIDEPNFLVQDLYTTMGFSKTFFFNKIKAMTGMGPKELIRLIKLKEAARLLSTDQYNISEVCYLVGYSETNYFRSLFKKQFNMTPSDYVKNLKNSKAKVSLD